MSNRYVKELSCMAERLVRDASYAFPSLREEFERDLLRLRSLSDSRGIHFYVADLPAAGKHLDKCLATGEYKRSGLPCTRSVSNRVVIPVFLRGLYLLVFREDGSLLDKPSIEAIFFLRQILCFAKKTEIECSQRAKDREIQEFVELDVSLPEPSGFWWDGPESLSQVPDTSFTSFGYRDPGLVEFLGNLDTVSGILASTLGSYDPSQWRHRHGPGAISEVTGPTNKYTWRNWSDRLERQYPIADCGYHNYSSWAGSMDDRDVGSTDPSSRLICVPKTYLRPRLIAAEPSEHQWCQQNIWHYFCSQARGTWIGEFCRFRDQTLNQDLCLRGSRSGDLVTLDLSSASDRVTTQAVEALFRVNPPLLRALAASRTLNVMLPSGELHRLRKFATMGSAVTFPVETLLFLSIVLTSVLTKRALKPSERNIRSLIGEVAVFGDDLVVPGDSWELCARALECLHFKINPNKSFATGRFRESCGVEAFDGQVVTPAYWKGLCTGKPDSIAMTSAVHRNFVEKFLMNSAQYIASTLTRGRKLPVVKVESGVVSLYSRTQVDHSGFRTRWNPSYMREEVLLPCFIGRQLRTPVSDDSAVFQFFTESPSPYDLWRSGVPQRPVLRIRDRWVSSHDLIAH